MIKQMESSIFKQQANMELKGKTHKNNIIAVKVKNIGQSISESLRNLAFLDAHFSQSLGILSPLDEAIFIKQFIDKDQTPLLLHFLLEIITKGKEFRIDESEHKNVLNELFSVYDKCISCVQKSLPLEEKEEYQVIVTQTKQMIDLISKSEDKRYSKMDKKMITITNMLRLDALQFVLLANYEYQNLYGQYGINCSIYSRIIRYKFYLTQSQYKSYPKLFQTMLNFLQFRYEQYYQQAISLLCLLKIAFSRTLAWQKQQKLLFDHPQITCNQTIEPPLLKMNYWKKNPTKIALRFCQFCKFPQGISIPNHQILDIRKQQTMIQLQKIPKDASLFKIGRILIHLRVKLQIPLQQVCHLYSSMKDNPLLRYNEIQQIKKKMEPCKWVYVSAINTQKSLQRLTQTKVDEKLLVKRHNPISIALTEITFERFYAYRKALNLQLQISQRFKHSTPIYIYCCECCYHSYCQNNYQRRAKRQSPTNLIIIAFQNNRLLFSFTIKGDIIQEQLIDVFTMYFEQNPIEKGTDLIVYYKKYESKMDNEVIDRYANNFKKKYNSFVYFSMEPQHFKQQIAIYHLIIYYLRKERHLSLLNFEERLYAITRLITTKIYCFQR